MNILIVFSTDSETLLYLLNTTDQSVKNMVVKFHNRYIGIDEFTEEERNYLEYIDTRLGVTEPDVIPPTMIDHVVSTGWY